MSLLLYYERERDTGSVTMSLLLYYERARDRRRETEWQCYLTEVC